MLAYMGILFVMLTIKQSLQSPTVICYVLPMSYFWKKKLGGKDVLLSLLASAN